MEYIFKIVTPVSEKRHVHSPTPTFLNIQTSHLITLETDWGHLHRGSRRVSMCGKEHVRQYDSLLHGATTREGVWVPLARLQGGVLQGVLGINACVLGTT